MRRSPSPSGWRRGPRSRCIRVVPLHQFPVPRLDLAERGPLAQTDYRQCLLQFRERHGFSLMGPVDDLYIRTQYLLDSHSDCREMGTIADRIAFLHAGREGDRLSPPLDHQLGPGNTHPRSTDNE